MKEYLNLTIAIAKHDGRVGGTAQRVQRATTHYKTEQLDLKKKSSHQEEVQSRRKTVIS